MASLTWIIILTFISTVFGTYPSEQFLNSACNETSDCSIVHSYCQKGICNCRSGYTIDASLTKCLKVATSYYGSCIDDHQCTKFLGYGAFCQDKKCVCDESWSHYLHGRCYSTFELNEHCLGDNSCYDGSEYQATSCNKGICKCNEGFYQRGKSSCRRKMTNVGDECLLDEDCDFKNGTCISHRCVFHGRPIVNTGTNTIVMKNTLNKNDGIKIGSECKNNSTCQSIENSFCDVDGTCICERAHFSLEDMSSCIPEIGEACDPNKSSFQVEYAVCRENMWTCPIDKVASRDNRKCIEVADDIGGTCDDDIQCRLLGPLGKCNLGKCSCPSDSHYNKEQRYCHLELGDHCKRINECATPHSICRNNKCECSAYYVQLDGQCVKGLYADCQIDDDCKAANNSVCCQNCDRKECRCKGELMTPPIEVCRPQIHSVGGCNKPRHVVPCECLEKSEFFRLIEEEKPVVSATTRPFVSYVAIVLLALKVLL